MLTEICQHLKNWFERDKYFGKFTISNGQLDNTIGLLDGQYFRVIGSVFNDGVHKYPSDELTDEVFEGAIWAMAVPPAVIDLSTKIQSWMDNYGDTVNTPYSSESFGGYSYTKAGSGSGNSSSSNPTWQSTFANELAKWRKI
jgi:hypothetical protein